MNHDDERRRLQTQQLAVRDEIRRRHRVQQADEARPILNDNIQAPTSAMRLRMEGVRHRARSRLQARASLMGSGGSVQQAVERLNEASSNLSSLLDQPIPRIGSPDLSAREYSGEAEVNRSRKRRRLDPEFSSLGHMDGFSYGYRGQVVPGPLRMELVRCDGGIHADATRHGNGKEYCPENVLRNDKSVYCTNNSRCNLILRHKGETTFCLKKLVIKAPERGFTAPLVQAMSTEYLADNKIVSRKAWYSYPCAPTIFSLGPPNTSCESLLPYDTATTQTFFPLTTMQTGIDQCPADGTQASTVRFHHQYPIPCLEGFSMSARPVATCQELTPSS